MGLCAGDLSPQVSTVPQQVQEQSQVAFCVGGNQEVLAHGFVSKLTQPLSDQGIGKQVADLTPGPFHRAGEQSGVLVDDLARDGTVISEWATIRPESRWQPAQQVGTA